MDKTNHLIEIAKSAHQHMPVLVSLLAGLFIMKKRSYFFSDDENLGDNFPIMLNQKEGDTR